MRLEDTIRLRHMLDAAEEAARFAAGASRSDLDTNRMLAFALVRAIEIVGEAAGRVGEETRIAYPDLPWQAMTRMRNRVVHAYFDVDLDRVWDTVTEDLPPLAVRLREILPQVRDH
ncbi:MAG: HepT-like ribonuclease domain-containing protein [Armatimonadota bacterium]|jgi:uncharacterized protein with HEPN domain